jgi:hypothetical protein
VSPKAKEEIRYWVPELLVVVFLGAVIGSACRFLGIGSLAAWILMLCFYAIFGHLMADALRKMTAPRKKEDH